MGGGGRGGYFCLVSMIFMFNIDFQVLLVLIYTVLKTVKILISWLLSNQLIRMHTVFLSVCYYKLLTGIKQVVGINIWKEFSTCRKSYMNAHVFLKKSGKEVKCKALPSILSL